MNAYELFAAMDGIGDEILERSEIKRKSPRRYIRPSLIAACCALVLSVLYAQLRYGILHPAPQVEATETQETMDQTEPTAPPVIQITEESYMGAELIMQLVTASYVPEDGSDYLDIRFSEEELSLYIQDRGRYKFEYVQIKTMTREELVGQIGDTMIAPHEGKSDVVDADAVIPQCEAVTVYSYREKETDTYTAYSVCLFDGVPKWFVESKFVRIYSMLPMPEQRYMTLNDVRALAQLEGQITWEHLAGFTATSWGSGVVRADFYVEDGYILRFYMEGTELVGDGELVCIPINLPVGIRDANLEEFLQRTQSVAEEWARKETEKNTRYLPIEDNELWSEAVVQTQWLYGTYMNSTMQCFRKGQQVLYWSVGDSRFAEGIGPLIEAEELTLEMLENCVEPDGKIYADILFNDVWVSIDAQDIPAQWLYEQLIAVRERVGLNALNRFQQILQQPDLEGLCLKIYYMDPVVLTYAPLSAEDVKYAADINVHVGQMICVDTQTLLEHTELLKRLDTSVVKPAEELGYVNARMCYVFETADGEEILEVVINGPKDRIYVNGVQVERDLVFLEVIEPFITEDLREAWQWDLAQWGT